MTPTLAQALAHIAPQYNAAQHKRAAERMVQDMQKNPNTPEFWEDATPIGTDINGRELRAVAKKQNLIYVNGEWKENAVKTAHTPGPWHCEDHTEVIARVPSPDSPGRFDTLTICRAADVEIYHDNRAGSTDANARLIAASPDLLRALEDALPTLQSHMERYPNDKDERRIYDAARAAIDKARGK